MHVELDLIADELGDVAIIELKTRDVISDMLNKSEN
jgi:Holliday junction resolvase-like predicted endonuclease